MLPLLLLRCPCSHCSCSHSQLAELTNLMTGADGDAAVDHYDDFTEIAPCGECGGLVKPDVVFFGDVVPRDVVSGVYAAAPDCAESI